MQESIWIILLSSIVTVGNFSYEPNENWILDVCADIAGLVFFNKNRWGLSLSTLKTETSVGSTEEDAAKSQKSSIKNDEFPSWVELTRVLFGTVKA